MIAAIVVFGGLLCCFCFCLCRNASNKRYQVGVYEMGNQNTNLSKNNISGNDLETQENGIDDENLQVGTVAKSKMGLLKK
jgi:hypothetical protein